MIVNNIVEIPADIIVAHFTIGAGSIQEHRAPVGSIHEMSSQERYSTET
jgi:hypothetical protein